MSSQFAIISDADRLTKAWWADNQQRLQKSRTSFAAGVLKSEGLCVRQPSTRALTVLAGPRLLPAEAIASARRTAFGLHALIDRAVAYSLAHKPLRERMLGALTSTDRRVIDRAFGGRCSYLHDRCLALLGSSLSLSRFDFRIVKSDTADHFRLSGIEADGPTGTHYVTALQQKIWRTLGIEPTAGMLDVLSQGLQALGRQSGHVEPTIGLIAHDPDSDAASELTNLSRALRFRRTGIRFVVGTVDQLEVGSDGGLAIAGERLGGVWRMWGLGFGDDEKRANAVLEALTPMLNPPYASIREWPLMQTLLRADPNLRAKLSQEERELVDTVLPGTELIATEDDLNRVRERTEGARGQYRLACARGVNRMETDDADRAGTWIEEGKPLIYEPACHDDGARFETAWFLPDGDIAHAEAASGALVYTLQRPDGTPIAGPIAADAREIPDTALATGRAWGLVCAPEDLDDTSSQSIGGDVQSDRFGQ